MYPDFHFCSLPDDVLYTILALVNPLDILRLRQTCKYLRDLTLENVIWTSSYRNSSFFLPPGPSPSHSVPELERILVRAQRLDVEWDTISQSSSFLAIHKTARKIRPESSNKLIDILHMQLIRGRYLFLGLPFSFELYDLDRDADWDKPTYKRVSKKRLKYRMLLGSDLRYASNEYAHVLAKEADEQDTLWKIQPLEANPISPVFSFVCSSRLASFEVTPNGYFLLSPRILDHPFVYHIGTGRRYCFPDVLERSSDFITLPDMVIVSHTQFPNKAIFQVFRYPDEFENESRAPLERTHSGILDIAFTEPKLICETVSSDSTRNLTFTAFNIGYSSVDLIVFDVNLHPDGTITSRITANREHKRPTYSLHGSLCYSQERQQVRVRLASLGSGIRLYDVQLSKSNEEIRSEISQGQLVNLGAVPIDHVFDGFVGRLCTSHENEVLITDIV
ncbi:hypothetical protein VKT23_006803 [Stygiomarasmius scandens]|uniref:F-box domain-containing protein n=1 Tax=Marasmiellus scandens TaxID=2682957 RepID=A0ABR1JNG0_9AGAR